MMCPCEVVFLLCLLSIAVPAPVTIYADFKFSESMSVKNREQAKFDCSGTFPKGSSLRWYREKDDDTGELLEVTDKYWKSEFQAEYQISTSFDSTKDYFMSQLTIRTVKDNYAGNYYCKVLDNKGDLLVKSTEISLKVTGGNKGCREPVVTRITGEWDDERNMTTVSWTVDPPLKSQWCKGSKLLWFIRYCPWDSIDKVPDDLASIDPDSEDWSAWMDLEKRQNTINMVDISDDKYYLFEIGWRSKHKDTFHYKHASRLFYFGEQVDAKIIKADDVTVKAGENAVLSCTVDGLPQPKVIWTIALADNKPSLGSQIDSDYEPVAPFVKTAYINGTTAEEHQRRYTCVVKNTVIRDGLKTTVIDTATVKLTVQD